MGIGQRKLINICSKGEQTAINGPEPKTELIKQVWAEVKDLSIGNSFTGYQAATTRSYEFLIDYDSSLAVDFNNVIEYANRSFLIRAVERGDRESVKNKNSFRFLENQEGMYLKLTADCESYG